MFGLQIPQSIFVHADGFLRAGTAKSDPPNPYDMTALVTNSAMASELYLKCLIHIETGQLVKKQHNLKQLFALLPEAARLNIQQRFDSGMAKQPAYDYSGLPEEERKKYETIAANMPKNLIDALRKGADAFVEWRYLYEDESGNGPPFSLFGLPHILRSVILERKPEWANFRFNMKQIASVPPTSRAQ